MRTTPITAALGASAIAIMAAAPASAFLGFQVNEARSINVEGKSFNAELAREYKSFARYEADRMLDWIDADYFAAKAIAAAEGKTVAPEMTADWNLDDADAAALAEARTRLVAKLDSGARAQWPDVAARAQANFDCWMEQQEEDWQTRHINACKQAFQTAMATMTPTETKVSIKAPAFQRIEEGAVVYFDHDVAQVDAKGQRALEALARSLKDDRDIFVTVTGHTDRSGDAAYNQRLSERRAANVSSTLTGLGLTLGDLEELDVEAKGESQPAVATGDGVREPANRRVIVDAYARERIAPKQTSELK